MKRFVCILLCLMVLLSSCGNPSVEKSREESSEQSASEESSEQPQAVIDTVVYFRLCEEWAEKLAYAVKERSGIELTLKKYEQTTVIGENTVIIGKAADGVGDKLCESVNDKDYGVKSQNGRIYIYGGSTEAVCEGVDWFIDNCVTENGIEISEDYFYRYDYVLENSKINGVSLEDFSIIYADTANEATYKDTANDFKRYIKDTANIKMYTFAHNRAEGEKEIIIGITPKREKTSKMRESSFEYNKYRVIIEGTKVFVVGNNAVSVWHGCMALAKYIAESENKNAVDKVIDGECKIVKVACLGDSITKGANSDNPAVYNYPAYLQKMMGYDYLVKEYGADGYSVCFGDTYSVKKSSEYADSLRFVPDVLLFMLGTNDCNPQAEKAWVDSKGNKTNREQSYRDSVNAYLDSYRKLNKDVQIFISLPPILHKSTVWTLWEEWARRVTEYAMPLNREIAAQQSLPVIDMYSWSMEHPEVFPDGLHPKNTTYKTYAQRIYEEIKDVIIKPDDLK